MTNDFKTNEILVEHKVLYKLMSHQFIEHFMF